VGFQFNALYVEQNLILLVRRFFVYVKH